MEVAADDGLGAVSKVAELAFPEYEGFIANNGVTVFKAHRCIFT